MSRIPLSDQRKGAKPTYPRHHIGGLLTQAQIRTVTGRSPRRVGDSCEVLPGLDARRVKSFVNMVRSFDRDQTESIKRTTVINA